MLRLLAAVIFTATGGMIGFMRTEKLRTSRRIVEEIRTLTERLEFMVGFRSDDVYTICRSLRRDAELTSLTFIENLPGEFRCGEVFNSQWSAAVKSQQLDTEEEAILMKIGGILGKTDSSGQLSALSGVKIELSELSERRKAEYLRKSRLYRSAGLLMGAMAGILVI